MKIVEIFKSLQGEGPFQGCVCSFIRLFGCNLNCAWCDTNYALQGGYQKGGIDEVLQKVETFQTRSVEVTGGEPLIQEDSITLMERLLEEGYNVLLETNGSRTLEKVPGGVCVVMDVKPPSSGEEKSLFLPNLDMLRKTDCIKFVMKDKEDFDYGEKFYLEHLVHREVPIYISLILPSSLRLEEIKDVGKDFYHWMQESEIGQVAKLQVQLHKILGLR